MPESVLPRNGGPDSSFHRWHRAVPHRYVGYAEYNGMRPPFMPSRIVIAFVQAKMLRHLCIRLRAVDDDGRKGRRQ